MPLETNITKAEYLSLLSVNDKLKHKNDLLKVQNKSFLHTLNQISPLIYQDGKIQQNELRDIILTLQKSAQQLLKVTTLQKKILSDQSKNESELRKFDQQFLKLQNQLTASMMNQCALDHRQVINSQKPTPTMLEKHNFHTIVNQQNQLKEQLSHNEQLIIDAMLGVSRIKMSKE